MAAVTIRRLKDETVRRWKAHAEARGRSMESELRQLIEDGPERSEQEDRGFFDPEAMAALDLEAEALKGPDGKFRPGPEWTDWWRRRGHALFGPDGAGGTDSLTLLREDRDADPTQWDGR